MPWEEVSASRGESRLSHFGLASPDAILASGAEDSVSAVRSPTGELSISMRWVAVRLRVFIWSKGSGHADRTCATAGAAGDSQLYVFLHAMEVYQC